MESTYPTAGGINYAKAQCMDASKEISQCYCLICYIYDIKTRYTRQYTNGINARIESFNIVTKNVPSYALYLH